jgi:hypothetical protein
MLWPAAAQPTASSCLVGLGLASTLRHTSLRSAYLRLQLSRLPP